MTETDRRAPLPRRARWARRLLLPALATASLSVFVASSPGQEEIPSAEPETVWIEARDRGGRVPKDLSPSQLLVYEGGREAQVLGLSRSDSAVSGRVVLYFDPSLASTGALRRGAEALARRAEDLVALGEVTLVIAEPDPEIVLATRDPLALAERLRWLAANEEGRSRPLEILRSAVAEIRAAESSAVENSAAENSGTAFSGEELAATVRGAIDEEVEAVRRRFDSLLSLLASDSLRPEGDPALVFLVAQGFDLDPLVPFAQQLDEAGVRALSPLGIESLRLERIVRDTGKGLAALGWTALPTALETEADDETFSPDAIDLGDPQGPGSATPETGTSGIGFTFRPGALKRERERREAEAAGELEAEFLRPREPLELLAQATGGELVATEGALRDATRRFGQRFELTYRPRLGFGDGLGTLDVSARGAELSVRAPAWASRGTPPPVTAARLRSLVEGRELSAPLDVAAALRLDDGATPELYRGELDTRVDLRDYVDSRGPDDLSSRPATFRVSLALTRPGREPELSSEVVDGQDLRSLEDWRYSKNLDVPADAEQVAVVVEELRGGRWGGTLASVVAGNLAQARGDVLPSPQVIEILRPEDEILRGRVKFETRVLDPKVARVSFLLDDEEVEVVERPPFDARLRLGRTPRRQELTVVAYGPGGEELGRHSAVLNGGRAGLAVDIVRPSNRRGTGWVEVEADVAVPLERRLDRVIFYWNAEQTATLYAPPFRQRIYVPPDRPVGYVRVVALLEDGTLAEDAELLNGPEAGERVEVQLVELYVVAADEDGRPVRGLEQSDFRVREDGVEQEIATFSDASNLPLTLGLAIDSSASMFVKLPNVQRAATRFLRSTFSENDRAFLVDFDTQPRLARGTTSDLDRLLYSIESLEPGGRTALWESIVFSLVQLQGVPGRKALIVFSDGADEDDQFPFSSCLRVAREMGVPIYLILMKREPESQGGLNLFSRPLSVRIDRLVGTVGGRVFYAKEYDDLDQIYAEIERELRSQYLLAYYPKASKGERSWRGVDVEVLEKGLETRTLKGYWP